MFLNPLLVLSRVRPRTIAVVWLVVAAVAVTVATPRRWNGAYLRANGVRASYVPLRPITATEGAALVKCKWATFRELTPQSAYISTRVYLLPRSPLVLASGELRCPDVAEEVHGVDKGGTSVNFRIIHKIDRRALEELLGRSLSAADITPPAGFTSYVSYRWWVFAIGDALFITGFYTALTLLLRRFRRPSSLFALPAVFVASSVAWILGLLVYSPASILGGSSYYHRVLVETGPWPHWSSILPSFMADGSVWLSVALAGLLILGLIRARERIRAIGAISPVRYWTGLAVLSLAAASLLTSAAYYRFILDRQNAATTVDSVARQFPGLQPVISADQVLNTGTPTESVDSAGHAIEWNLLTNGRLELAAADAVRQLLGSRSGNQLVSIYFRTSAGTFARASDHPAYQGPYMDIRYLRSANTEDGHAYLVETMINQTRDMSQPFLLYLFRPHREGRLLRAQDGTVFGVAISEITEAPPILRPLATFVCGFQCQYLEWN